MIDYFYYLLLYIGASLCGVGIYGLLRMAWKHWADPGISTEMNAHDLMENWERASPWNKP